MSVTIETVGNVLLLTKNNSIGVQAVELIYTLKSLGWLSPDQLAARDAEVTRMTLEMAANRADVIAGFQKNAQTDTDTPPDKVGNYHHGENVAIGIRDAILALAPPATGMKLVPEVEMIGGDKDHIAAVLLYHASENAVTVKP